IGHGDGEAVATVVVGVGRVGPAAVGGHDHRAVNRVGALGIAPRIAVGVGGRDAAGYRRVFGRRDRDVRRRRRVIDRRDADRHGGRGAVFLAVGHGDGEAVAAVVVGVGRVGPAAVGIDDHRAMRRVGALGVVQRVTVHVGGRHAAGYRRVFGRRDR